MVIIRDSLAFHYVVLQWRLGSEVGSHRSTNTRKGGDEKMPMYVVLGRHTQKAIENMKASPERQEAAKKVARSLGGEIKELYYTMGRYDFVAICEAPNDEAMTKALLIVSGSGAVRTETLPAIPADKAAEIFKGLP